MVAMSLAVDHLRSKKCDIALAGGVAIAFPQQVQFIYFLYSIFNKIFQGPDMLLPNASSFLTRDIVDLLTTVLMARFQEMLFVHLCFVGWTTPSKLATKFMRLYEVLRLAPMVVWIRQAPLSQVHAVRRKPSNAHGGTLVRVSALTNSFTLSTTNFFFDAEVEF
jgi:hypothetical protein